MAKKEYVPAYYKGKSSLLERFLHAMRGIMVAWKKEPNFKIEVFIAFIVLITMFILPLPHIQRAVLFLIITIVLVLEIVNSVFEQVIDLLHPHFSIEVAKIKDTMAGGVFVASLASVVIGAFILIQPFISFDIIAEHYIEFLHKDIVVSMAEQFTLFGNWQVAGILTVISFLVLIFVKKYKLAQFFIGSVLFSQVITLILKVLIGRERPLSNGFDGVSAFSFPSGHVVTAVTLWFSLAYILAQSANSKVVKKLIWIMPIVVVVCVSISRIILSAHWTSDVIGGFIIGIFWLLFWYGMNEKIYKKIWEKH